MEFKIKDHINIVYVDNSKAIDVVCYGCHCSSWRGTGSLFGVSGHSRQEMRKAFSCSVEFVAVCLGNVLVSIFVPTLFRTIQPAIPRTLKFCL